jgi:hypothetical protein
MLLEWIVHEKEKGKVAGYLSLLNNP